MRGAPGNLGVFFVPKRDYDVFVRRGYVAITDLVPVHLDNVVMEVDQVKLTSRPIGLSKDQAHRTKLVEAAKRQMDGPLVRLRDLVTIADIARKTGRSEATVKERWTAKPDWPKPVGRFGRSDVYLWPEIVAFCQRHRWPVRKPRDQRGTPDDIIPDSVRERQSA